MRSITAPPARRTASPNPLEPKASDDKVVERDDREHSTDHWASAGSRRCGRPVAGGGSGRPRPAARRCEVVGDDQLAQKQPLEDDRRAASSGRSRRLPGRALAGSRCSRRARARPVLGASAPARRRGRDRRPADGSAHPPAASPDRGSGRSPAQTSPISDAAARVRPGVRPAPGVLTDRAVERPGDALDAKRTRHRHDREHRLACRPSAAASAVPPPIGRALAARRGGSVVRTARSLGLTLSLPLARPR